MTGPNSTNWFRTHAAALMSDRIPGHASEYMTHRELIHELVVGVECVRWGGSGVRPQQILPETEGIHTIRNCVAVRTSEEPLSRPLRGPTGVKIIITASMDKQPKKKKKNHHINICSHN